MKKSNNFLCKIPSIIMLLSCNAVGAVAEGPIPAAERYGVYSSNTIGTEKTICPSGQYVYSCGAYKVGYNWLKSVTLTSSDGTEKTTNDYYIGDTTYEKIEQMRAFFNNAPRRIKYKKPDAPAAVTTTNTNSEVLSDRNFLLGLICNPLDTSLTITCAPCPNGGTVASTTVKLGNDISKNEDNLLLISGSWNFHTIADCYVTEFEDATGSFVYIPYAADSGTATGEQCYYTNTSASAEKFVAGDYISSGIAGANTANVQTVEPDIPE